MANNKLDIKIFGATGYTGKCTAVQVHKLVKGLTWGIAGRNESKLKDVLTETAERCGVADFNNIPIILANVEDEDSIRKMTAQAKLIINCCGPYDLYGEVVVKSCVETGTHYVDVTGESHFIERMMLKYGENAEKNGVYIVNSCGVDCIPTDLGICFMEANFAGTINSVESYMRFTESRGKTPGAVANYGTWASIVHGLGTFYKTFALKKRRHLKMPVLKPKLSVKLLQSMDDGYALPFPTADADVVYHSQQYFYKNCRPVQMFHYAVVPSLMHIFFRSIYLLFIGILAQFKFGQSLLLKYPEFFSFGFLSHSPSEARMEKSRFTATLKCRGWSDKQKDVHDEYDTPPNIEMIGCISGANPAYGFTCIALTLCALMILTEPKNLPTRGGVLTTAAAFSKTSLVQKLQDNGVIFKVLSTKEV